MEERSFRFWHRIQVRYRDVDMQRIVYYGVYLQYFDVAVHEYFRTLGYNIAETAERGEFDTATVHVEIDYLRSARWDDLLDIGVRVERLGRSSFDVAIDVVHATTRDVLCRAKLVLVNYNSQTGRAQPLPDGLRSAVMAFEGLSA